MFYAKSTGGFYTTDIHGDNVPADAVDESEWSSTYKALMLAQSQGKVITADARGCPIAVDPMSLLSLAQLQAAQIAAITNDCQAAIVGGFTSSGLGAPHTYPAQVIDQQNLSVSVLSSMMPNLPSDWTTPFWCADSSGNWSYAIHTAAQIQQVGEDGKAAIIAAIQKKAGLVAQINAATTVAAVQAITWPAS